MTDEKSTDQLLERVIVPRVTRLNAIVNGTVTGLVGGLLVALSTIWLLIKGGDVVGPHLSLLGQFFIGYEVTWLGSIVGFGYGFGLGFLLGFGVATLYNWFLKFKSD